MYNLFFFTFIINFQVDTTPTLTTIATNRAQALLALSITGQVNLMFLLDLQS
jgi:hypothetical protein